MQSNILLYFLALEKQRQLQAEAETFRRVKEAEGAPLPRPRYSLKSRLGGQLIRWGARLQDRAVQQPIPATGQSPCSG